MDIKLKEIASRIDAALDRIEKDPVLNQRKNGKGAFLFSSGAIAVGRYVQICYVSYQGRNNLTKDEALQYLAWLEAGNVGRHYEALGKI